MKKKVSVKEPVRLRVKELAGGNKSLYLDTYFKGKRVYEFLRLYIVPETDQQSKILNADAWKMANLKKAKRIMELNADGMPEARTQLTKITVCDLMEQFAKHKVATDHGNMAVLAHRTENYIKTFGAGDTMLIDVDKNFCLDFISFLKNAKTAGGKPLSNYTQFSYYACLNAALNYATREELINSNPCGKVPADVKIKKEESTREYLTVDELKTLMATPAKNELIKAAYLFACFCGLRYSDVIRLRWQDIEKDGERTRAKIIMKKTKRSIYLPLSGEALKWMPDRGTAADGDEIFKLPLLWRIEEALQRWATDGGINKHVTFHTSRHTFATLMLTTGADLYAVSKLLGHTNIATTQIYAKIVDKSKDDAVNRLSDLFNQ